MLGISTIVPQKVWAEHTRIDRLIAQVKEAPAPLHSTTLEEIAMVTYDILADVPLVGIQDSQKALESLIRLARALNGHHGVLERLLATGIQDGIDRVLLFEVAREAAHSLGTQVQPPYLVDSLQVNTVSLLLQANAPSEREAIQYIRTLQGKFATFCRSKNFSIEDFLSGKALGTFPNDLKPLMWDIQLAVLSSDRSRLDDTLFMYTLTRIDQAQDIRMLCDIYLTISPSSWNQLETLIESRLGSPPPVRVSDGEYNTPDKVFRTAETSVGHRMEEYPTLLTGLFLPYLSDTEIVANKIRGILLKYTGKEQGISVLATPGAWLELVE